MTMDFHRGGSPGRVFFAILASFALPAAAALAETGVTPAEIILGETSAFTGPSAGLGIEQWRGHDAAFEEINARGGVHGRKIRVVLTDDAYDAAKAVPALLDLITHHKVFAIFGGVGTPTLVKTLPVLLKYHLSEDLFRFSNFSGGQPAREPPFEQAVFSVRASYRQETKAMVDAFAGLGLTKIGIYVQDDAYGASVRDGVRRALKARGLDIVFETTYPRGQVFATSTAVQVKLLRDAGAQAVIMAGAYQACAGFVRDARISGWTAPIHSVSFVGADQMLRLLNEAEQQTGRKLTERLIVTQVVPVYTDTSIPLVREYRAAMDKYKPVVAAGVSDGSYQPLARYSFGSLEGYLNAKVFIAILERTGATLTRKSFYQATEKMGRFDVGLGVPLEFSTARHQALDKVWFTYVTRDGWRTTDDLSAALNLSKALN